MLLDLDTRDQQRGTTRDMYSAVRPVAVLAPRPYAQPIGRWLALGFILLAMLFLATLHLSDQLRLSGFFSFQNDISNVEPSIPAQAMLDADPITATTSSVELTPASADTIPIAPLAESVAPDTTPEDPKETDEGSLSEPVAAATADLATAAKPITPPHHEEQAAVVPPQKTTPVPATSPKVAADALKPRPQTQPAPTAISPPAPAPTPTRTPAPVLNTKGPQRESAAEQVSPAQLEKTVLPLSVEEQAEAHYRQALKLLHEQRGLEAAERLRLALDLHPRHLSARDTLIEWMLSQGHWEGVKPVLAEGISLVPDHYRYALWLARVHAEQGDDTRAIGLLEGARGLAKDNADYLGLLGSIYQRNARHGEARQAFQQAAMLQPQQTRWSLGVAISSEALRDWQAANAAYTQVVDDARGDMRLREYAGERLTAIKKLLR